MRLRLVARCLLLSGVLPVLAHCGPELVGSAQLRDSPALADGQLGALASNAFGANLLTELTHRYCKCSGNALIAPESIGTTLAMLAAGSGGATQTELQKTLGYATTAAMVQDQGSLDHQLRRFGSPGPELELATRVWADQGLALSPAFQGALAGAFGAGVGRVDFAGAPDRARDAINQWVETETHGLIKDMLASLEGRTALVLTSAVHFKAAWQRPFASELTTAADFDTGTRKVSVPMMARTGGMAYAESGAFQVVELPYANGAVAFDVILPKAAGLAPWTATDFGESLRAALLTLSPHFVELSLPRFSFGAQVQLGEPLKKLGINAAFSPGADFSGMFDQSQDRGLSLSEVVHKTHIDVTEAGTEAGASTAGVIAGLSDEPPVTFNANRPFAFALRDTGTGAFIFIGILVDPSQGA